MVPTQARATQLHGPTTVTRPDTTGAGVLGDQRPRSLTSSGIGRTGRTSHRIGGTVHSRRSPHGIPEQTEDLEVIDRLLDSSRAGAGGCFTLRGTPGTGRAALLEYAERQAAGMRTLRVAGIQSETGFRYAAAHQLLVPLLSRVDRLPEPQRDALLTVAGLASGPDPDRFLTGLAMLTLLSDAAGDRPLLVTVDDAQWLDPVSAQLLGFVARRVDTRPIAFLVAVGEHSRSRGVAEASTPRRVHADDPAVPEPPGQPRAGHPGEPAADSRPPEPNSPAGPAVLLRDGFAARRTGGYRAAAPVLRAALDAILAQPPAPDAGGNDLFAVAGQAAGDLLDDRARGAVASRWVRAERDGGSAPGLSAALVCLAQAEVMAGRLASAEETLAQARLIAQSSAVPVAPGAVGLAELSVMAWRGRADDARSAAARLDGREGAVLDAAQSALAVLELASGCYGAALARALEVHRHDLPELGTQILPDLVEAASRAGEDAAAAAALDRFAERASASGTRLAFGLLARCRALLADATAADALYREAIEHLAPTTAAPQLARTHLLYGEWLRRQRRRRDARQQLRTAVDLFDTMGMEAFARRARTELRATGERAARHIEGPDNQLTPQESQIAALVADGLTNREIAVRLFISTNTVEYHLQKVFRKLDVRSRTQLARTLLTAA